jgi:hypothetical protein
VLVAKPLLIPTLNADILRRLQVCSSDLSHLGITDNVLVCDQVSVFHSDDVFVDPGGGRRDRCPDAG